MIPNAVVKGIHLGQSTPFYECREIQIQPGQPDDHSSLMDVPIIEWRAWDWPESVWLRGDTLIEYIIEAMPGTPVNNPWSVTRVIPQHLPIPMRVLSIARPDVLQTQAIVLSIIAFSTIDPTTGDPATPATGYDQIRQDQAVLSDESYGSGWNTPSANGYYQGSITIGLLEREHTMEITEPGVLDYEEAQFVVDMGQPLLHNEDILVLPDGRRGTVSRQRTTLQINGVAIGTLYGLSLHNKGQGTVIYNIPV